MFCILVIFAIIIFTLLRRKAIYNYRKKCINKTHSLKYIPKKIFQLISDKNNISPEFQENIEYIKNLNKDWQYTLYDDKDIVEYITNNYGTKMLQYYNSINPKYGAARADFFRYLLMYNEGGAYFDIKSGMKYPLSSVIFPEDEYILMHWDTFPCYKEVNNMMGEYQQWHIICRPRHPFLYSVINKVMENIDNYTKDRFGVGKIGVLKVTGPIVYTNAIMPIRKNHKHRLVNLNDFIGLVYNNIGKSHSELFSKTHYSKITEPIIEKNI